jgi:hypothetical protein
LECAVEGAGELGLAADRNDRVGRLDARAGEVRRLAQVGRAFELRCAVASWDEYLSVVERLGGEVLQAGGGTAGRWASPASAPRAKQAFNPRGLATRPNCWRHAPPLDAKLAELLGARVTDELVVALPGALSRRIEAAATADLQAPRGSARFLATLDPKTGTVSAGW